MEQQPVPNDPPTQQEDNISQQEDNVSLTPEDSEKQNLIEK